MQEEGVAIGIMVLGVLLFGYVIGAVTDLIRVRHPARSDRRHKHLAGGCDMDLLCTLLPMLMHSLLNLRPTRRRDPPPILPHLCTVAEAVWDMLLPAWNTDDSLRLDLCAQTAGVEAQQGALFREKMEGVERWMELRGLPHHMRTEIVSYYSEVWTQHQGAPPRCFSAYVVLVACTVSGTPRLCSDATWHAQDCMPLIEWLAKPEALMLLSVLCDGMQRSRMPRSSMTFQRGCGARSLGSAYGRRGLTNAKHASSCPNPREGVRSCRNAA